MIELDRFEKFILVLCIVAMLFDAGSTIYFSRFVGIEGELNIIVKFLIQSQEWKWLLRLWVLELVYLLSVMSICLHLRRWARPKYYEIMLCFIPLMRIMGGLSWIYAYILM